MHVFLVAGGTPSWRNSGWGHALTAGDSERVLVSFVEFSKDRRASIAVTPGDMVPVYVPKQKDEQ